MIIADTGFWLALADRRDADHHAAVEAMKRLREPLVTTWPVVTETCHLMARELGVPTEIRFVQELERGAAQLFPLTVAHLSRIEALLEKYADLPCDLADASLVVLAEELGSGRILSTDRRDFRAYRWKDRKPFTNLLAR